MLVAIVLGVTACQPARLSFREPPRGRALKIAIARHPAYAPLVVMKERQMLERRLPETAIEWKVFGSIEAMGTALTDRGLDIGTGSPSAMLHLRARGVPVAALGGISRLPLGVVTTDPRIVRLTQLPLAPDIGLPSTSGAESLFLNSLSMRTLGDAVALDRRRRIEAPAMSLQRLASREGSTAVLPPPWLDVALAMPGARLVASSADAADGSSLATLAFTTDEIMDRQREAIPVFVETLVAATAATPRALGEIVDELFEDDDSNIDRQLAARALASDAVVFGTSLHGFGNLLDVATVAGALPDGVDRASLVVDQRRGGVGVTALSRDRR